MSRQRSAVVLARPQVRAPLAGILAYLQAGGRCHHARSSADDLAGTTPTSSTASSPTTIGAGGLAWQVRWLSAADTLQVADRLRDLDVPAAGDVGADPSQKVMDGSGWRGIRAPSRGAPRAAGTSRPRTIPTGPPPSTRSWAPSPLVDPTVAGSRRRASNRPSRARPPRSSARGLGRLRAADEAVRAARRRRAARHHAAIKGGRYASVAAGTTASGAAASLAPASRRRRCEDVDPRRPHDAVGGGVGRAALVRLRGLPRPLEPAGVGHTWWRRRGRAVGVSRGVSPAELRRLYQRERLAPVEIGERFGVSGRTVSGWLRQLGIAPRPRSQRRRYVADGLSTGQLATLYGVSVRTVTRWLEDAGISRRRCGRRSHAPTREELRLLYQVEGLSTAQIGARYGVAQQTANRWVRAAGVLLRPQGQPTRASPGGPGPSP